MIENVDSGLAASGLLLRVSLYVVCLVLSGELCFDQPGAHAARFDPVLKFEFTTSINKTQIAHLDVFFHLADVLIIFSDARSSFTFMDDRLLRQYSLVIG